MINVRGPMEAYRLAILKYGYEAYSTCRQASTSVGDFLVVLKKKARVKFSSKIDPKLLRPRDVTLQMQNCSKFANQTGWVPTYNFEIRVEHLLNYCRERG